MKIQNPQAFYVHRSGRRGKAFRRVQDAPKPGEFVCDETTGQFHFHQADAAKWIEATFDTPFRHPFRCGEWATRDGWRRRGNSPLVRTYRGMTYNGARVVWDRN